MSARMCVLLLVNRQNSPSPSTEVTTKSALDDLFPGRELAAVAVRAVVELPIRPHRQVPNFEHEIVSEGPSDVHQEAPGRRGVEADRAMVCDRDDDRVGDLGSLHRHAVM